VSETSRRIAVVTGGNRGIGFEICRQLARKGVNVVLASRDAQRGKNAAKALQDDGLNVISHPLDVTHASSIDAFASYMSDSHRRCDVLVNNAGILVNGGRTSVMKESLEVMRKTVETNVYGPFLITQALVPLMRKNRYGRIVNLSSGLGQLSDMGDGCPAYRLSKTALNALTRMFAAATEGSGILVNSVCPGWVRTDMGGANADRSVEEGADTAVWLATLPDGGPTGGLFRDREAIPW
jgi:NAD(P)-dependent dehydrogenase (short-subunit alcohol dehydrogenase family)